MTFQKRIAKNVKLQILDLIIMNTITTRSLCSQSPSLPLLKFFFLIIAAKVTSTIEPYLPTLETTLTTKGVAIKTPLPTKAKLSPYLKNL
jgi:hypothetical protein